jgi:transcriptional regulator NrdR family protein
VLDSRAYEDRIRRRRICCACQHRFTTYELVVDQAEFDHLQEGAKGMAAQLRAMASILDLW